MSNLCNVDGVLVPEAEAKVSVLDRGFLFGDSIYEVIRTRKGIPFGWPEHLERLHASADGLELVMDVPDEELTRRIVETIRAAGNEESYCRIIVTRGEGTAPNIDVDYAVGRSTVIVMVRPAPDVAGRPAKLAIVSRARTDKRTLDPGIKSGNYLNNVMGLKEAKARGATDCLFMNIDGRLTEASTSNVWIIKGEAVITPALSAGLLAGVTRRLLFEMCREQDIPCVERDLFEEDIRGADGVFLTSTLRDIAPVEKLDRKKMPRCPLLEELMQRFDAFMDRRAEEVYKPALEGL